MLIIASIGAAILHSMGWPWPWAIVTGIGAGFIITTVLGFLLNVGLGAPMAFAEWRAERKVRRAADL
jgi:hypothetical protein